MVISPDHGDSALMLMVTESVLNARKPERYREAITTRKVTTMGIARATDLPAGAKVV